MTNLEIVSVSDADKTKAAPIFVPFWAFRSRSESMHELLFIINATRGAVQTVTANIP